MVKHFLFALALGASASQADTLSSAQVIDQVAQAAADQSDALQQVFEQLQRASVSGHLAHFRERWLQELAQRGDGTALAIAVLEEQLIAEHAEERDDYMAQFLAWDVDQDGIIDGNEAAEVLATDERHAYDLEQFDINRDQQITHDEILRVTQRRQGPFDLDDIAAMLVFDLNGDGFLIEAEITAVVDALTELSPTK